MLVLNLSYKFKFPDIPIALFMFQEVLPLWAQKLLIKKKENYWLFYRIIQVPFGCPCLQNYACSEAQLNYYGRLF